MANAWLTRDHGPNGRPRGQPEKTPKIEIFPAARRRLLLAMAALPLIPCGTAFAASPPPAGLARWGSGSFRRWGFLVYDATLWAAGDPQRPPLALELTYRRHIEGAAIAEASVKEMRQLGLASEATLHAWGEQMRRLFPDVSPGDRITGHYLAEAARFDFNDRRLGSIADPAFARAFFAIWLDPRTSAPDLRAALLTRPAGG
jgi:hypothetical protein